MQWIWITAAILAVAAIGIYSTGAMLPRDHAAERTEFIHSSPEAVFACITNFEQRPQWITGLKEVAIEPGGRFYTETHDSGPLRMEIIELAKPFRVVTRIADDTLPFGGTWAITIAPASGGVNVTVREDGFVKSPIFRFVSRFVLGHTRTMEQFLKDLSARYP